MSTNLRIKVDFGGTCEQTNISTATTNSDKKCHVCKNIFKQKMLVVQSSKCSAFSKKNLSETD
jgi:hypothetical protein